MYQEFIDKYIIEICDKTNLKNTEKMLKGPVFILVGKGKYNLTFWHLKCSFCGIDICGQYSLLRLIFTANCIYLYTPIGLNREIRNNFPRSHKSFCDLLAVNMDHFSKVTIWLEIKALWIPRFLLIQYCVFRHVLIISWK